MEEKTPQRDFLSDFGNPDFKADQYYDHKSFLNNLGGHFIDLVQTLVVVGAIVILTYVFAAQPHKVSGHSMVPTFQDADYIITDKVTQRLRKYEHQEVIVFHNPNNEKQDFIKRVIGVPGDKIKVENEQVYLNGKVLDEPYLPVGLTTPNDKFFTNGYEVTVKEGEYVVFGDNRHNSQDSRNWGPLPEREIVGKVFFRYWPLKTFGFFNPHPSN